MDHTKKMILLDERAYNNLVKNNQESWQKAIVEEYQENAWNKPAEKRSKTLMYKDMHSLLEDDDLDADRKMKLYNQQFIKCQNTNKGTEMMPVSIKPELDEEIKPVPSKRSQRKQKDPVARVPETVVTPSKKKKKPRRTSRQRKPIKWDSL